MLHVVQMRSEQKKILKTTSKFLSEKTMGQSENNRPYLDLTQTLDLSKIWKDEYRRGCWTVDEERSPRDLFSYYQARGGTEVQGTSLSKRL